MRIGGLRLAAAFTLLTAFAVASSAWAAAGNGAYVDNTYQCTTYDYGTVCSDVHYVDNNFNNSTPTPSGNVSGVNNYRTTTTFTGSGDLAGCTATTTQVVRSHYLDQSGTEQEVGISSATLDTASCSGASYTCSYGISFHRVDNTNQYVRPFLDCTPV